MSVRTGILGGTFDPVHVAHIALAQAALKGLSLDEIFFVPAYEAALRTSTASASADDRLKMLSIAVRNSGLPARIITFEVDQNRLCYSIETARYLKDKFPDRDFFWIIGSDHIAKLPAWKDIDELSGLVKFACATRPESGSENDAKKMLHHCGTPRGKLPEVLKIPFSPQPISSTCIRNALRNGKISDIEFALDKDVLKFILSKKLYR